MRSDLPPFTALYFPRPADGSVLKQASDLKVAPIAQESVPQPVCRQQIEYAASLHRPYDQCKNFAYAGQTALQQCTEAQDCLH